MRVVLALVVAVTTIGATTVRGEDNCGRMDLMIREVAREGAPNNRGPGLCPGNAKRE